MTSQTTYIDPLEQVYADLGYGKTRTHFDTVLERQGQTTEDFNLAVANLKKEAPAPAVRYFVQSDRKALRPR